MPVITPRIVEYKPVPVRRLLREMKDYASMMLDLAYYSAIYGDKMMAYEVLKIENEVHDLWSLVMMQTMLAARSPEDAERMLSIIRVATSLEVVSNAAADIAYVATIFTRTPAVLAGALLESEELVSRVEVGEKGDGLKLKDLVSFPRHADVLVVVRGHRWIMDPSLDLVLRKGDRLILRGTEEALRSIAEMVGYKLEVPVPGKREDLGEEGRRLTESLKWLKNIADVALDLAFYSVIYQDRSPAMEVLEIEEEVDSRVLALLPGIMDTKRLSGEEKACLSRILNSLEEITDAAANMASIIVANLPVHEVIELAEEESSEIIIKAVAKGLTTPVKLEDLGLDDIGAHVVAIKKASGAWHPLPSPSIKVEDGDILILKLYTEEDEKLLQDLARKRLVVQEE